MSMIALVLVLGMVTAAVVFARRQASAMSDLGRMSDQWLADLHRSARDQ
jgi:hypothetical protein